MKLNFESITIKMPGNPCYTEIEAAIDNIIYTLQPYNADQIIKDLITIEISYVLIQSNSFVNITIKPLKEGKDA